MLIRQTLGVPGDERYMDKFMLCPYKDGRNSHLLFHTEFQMVADYKFTERMADYMLLRSAKDRTECYALAIIGYAKRSYSNEYERGNPLTGMKLWFYDHIIGDQQEAQYQQCDCLISQLLYSVWLYEQQKKFSGEQLQAKLLGIVKNIINFGFSGDDYLCLLLFVARFALECLPDRQTFSNFVKQVDQLTPKIDTMTSIEHIKEIGKAEGKAEGRAEEREILTIKFIRTLLQASSFTTREIAKMTDTTVEKVEAVKNGL